MKTSIIIFLLAGACSVVFQPKVELQAGEDKNAHQKSTSALPVSTNTRPLPDPIVVRGWEIVSVSAMSKGAVKEIFPEYKQKRSFGNVTNNLAPAKGTFLVVLIQCQSATGDALNEPLWVGKPDVALVDDVGFEYAPAGKLLQLGTDYVQTGMGLGHATGRKSRSNVNNVLVYFDVPSTAQAFWIRFGENATLLPVNRLALLPIVGTD